MSVAARVDDWRADQIRSERAFREIVWPQLVSYLGGGTLTSLETTGTDDLDRTGGIDAYQRLQTGVRTITQRTQFVDDYPKPPTFTIRYSRQRNPLTEYQKRMDAIDKGFALPGLVIQAYVHEEKQVFVRAAVTHGQPFYAYVAAQANRWKRNEATAGSAGFLIVPWLAIFTDNATDRSSVPLLTKDGLGVVVRTPTMFFAGRKDVYKPFVDAWRSHALLWI